MQIKKLGQEATDEGEEPSEVAAVGVGTPHPPSVTKGALDAGVQWPRAQRPGPLSPGHLSAVEL